MDLMLEPPLDQLGQQVYGHYKVAEKHSTKAEENYKSSGLYLKAARNRVLKTRGLTWERWLKENCPISRSRADEVIMIADGRKSADEPAERMRKRRAEKAASAERSANRPEKPKENNAPYKESIIEEAESFGDEAMRERRERMLKIRNSLPLLNDNQLDKIEGIIFQ